MWGLSAHAAWDLVSEQCSSVRWDGQQSPRDRRVGFQEGRRLYVYMSLGPGGRERTEVG